MKQLFENWRKHVNEIRFRANNPRELGIVADELIEKFYNGDLEEEALFKELGIYLATLSAGSEMDVNALIDQLIQKKYSAELGGLLYDPSYRTTLIAAASNNETTT
jgi:hypothetical protein|tara:strand:- start:67 stop:384 length:318 start_codon:yes stop_codon:yes gene_type:complete